MRHDFHVVQEADARDSVRSRSDPPIGALSERKALVPTDLNALSFAMNCNFWSAKV